VAQKNWIKLGAKSEVVSIALESETEAYIMGANGYHFHYHCHKMHKFSLE
jgi:hypothetical protein